ncbi:MAG: hypothetical protein HGJ94_12200 [Desulfosarcina sp.]|nr:hypothetical protein [Desulfosarcina sp.]MBC2741617.1 hypothetical protein [Desulfosarcina sp.]MBC2764531.1 hypothetical protein [Desulfosarcina sp.]
MTDQTTSPKLRSPKTGQELLDMYFLFARSHLLETASILDRIQRAPDGDKAFTDLRVRQLIAACDIIKDPAGNRGERFQLLFSDPDE